MHLKQKHESGIARITINNLQKLIEQRQTFVDQSIRVLYPWRCSTNELSSTKVMCTCEIFKNLLLLVWINGAELYTIFVEKLKIQHQDLSLVWVWLELEFNIILVYKRKNVLAVA